VLSIARNAPLICADIMIAEFDVVTAMCLFAGNTATKERLDHYAASAIKNTEIHKII
jgi:hypothetical protein